MKIAITESENFSQEAFDRLSKVGDVLRLNIKSSAELAEKCQDADAIFIRLGYKIGKNTIDNLPKLKYILSATTGTDHIDEAYFTARGGNVICLKGETGFLDSIPSTAEHTWAILLALARKIPSAFDHVKLNGWDRNPYKGNNLRGKKFAILGLGRVGKQVAKFADAFGMEIAFYDTAIFPSHYNRMQNAEDLFAWGDVISIHIPLNERNVGFVNSQLLDFATRDAWLINTSRGQVWDELAVAEKLKNGTIKGVATDVIAEEHDAKVQAKNPLVVLAKNNYNLIITPHIAGATYESMEMTEIFIAQKFIKMLPDG